MTKGRLEAFSDGVLAIVITIMVLEMKVPHEASIAALQPLLPVFLSYVLSFIYIGIYWNNHHHMLHAAKEVNGSVLWANLHLLFWLSLFPFVTGWMGENHFSPIPVAIYGVVAFMAGVAYYFLAHCLANLHGKNSVLAQALGNDRKGILSVVFYLVGILLSFLSSWAAVAMYVLVAGIWFIPDKRIENIYNSTKQTE
ncbi:MAG TPA: TMEM175 family protein [Agriterribacter sp.]|nr:TMEM175 family protein [Agriterribacter sp.]